jgi:hypothetical protein
MDTFLVFIFLLFLLLATLRRFTHLYLERKFRYELYSIRDNLRLLAIENKIDSTTKIFDFYDLSISKLIDRSYYITLFYILYSATKNKKSNSEKVLFNYIVEETEKSPHLIKVQNEISKVVVCHIFDQHRVTLKVLSAILAPFLGAYYFTKKVKKLSESVLYSPQTSAISSFAT